nr:HD-GYP domain-containing protein [Butyrivibrio sp.]
DAMTSARYYRGPLCPFIAISMFEEEGFQKYDPEMIMAFLNNIVNTYLLNTVRLNTGEIGEIIFINSSHLSRPTIKVDNDYIDLSKCPGVYIQEII